jgi:hypothetical protein
MHNKRFTLVLNKPESMETIAQNTKK